ncbi:hypothetical protein Cob_v004903 [Colletotrichum orbiculare MAFF 240422]|uniref:Uncharacterized protein n=1 Tax=Colletotrichum orbiculare (strain 104-T / ATCC 96160 / CBS 514.97 / LARS 414 / MAFF 240422) TaxID=1213857 RepID=A0A484FX54_COLOR|nr:hypothetical protein Cob_v004903 [Colletotrichum orbiculare MAFF 240422]
MFARFPRLQVVYYEPWREWDFMQSHTDRAYRYLFTSIQNANNSLKRLVVFENFNQQYGRRRSRNTIYPAGLFWL